MPVPSSPYKGLAPFSEEDAPFFFGREEDEEIIIANLIASRLTLLFGSGGVGKSSVLRAGVAHRLHTLSRENMSELGKAEFTTVFLNNWRDDPLKTLIDGIQSAAFRSPHNQPPAPRPQTVNLIQTVQSTTEKTQSQLLIILDQFEEYFLYHDYQGEESTFFVEFPRLINSPSLPVHCLISLREDALAKLERFKGRIPNLFDNYLRIGHLSVNAAKEAIRQPLKQYNHMSQQPPITIEPQLIDAILQQLRTGQIDLRDSDSGAVTSDSTQGNVETPFLQLVMTRLWGAEMKSSSRVLRLETLHMLGGASQIVRTHLDDSLHELTSAEQTITAEIFRFLVTPSGTKIAHTASDLAAYTKISTRELAGVLEKLSGGNIRILRAVAPPVDRPTSHRYEIFHDVLAPGILDWRRRFIQAQEQERAKMEAEDQLARERMRARRLWRLVLGLTAVMLILFLLTAFAIRQRSAARQAEAAARAQRELAEKQRAIAEENSIKAEQAFRTIALEAQRSRNEAESLRDIAKRAQREADAQRQLAERARQSSRNANQ